jgi:hypothetical protein
MDAKEFPKPAEQIGDPDAPLYFRIEMPAAGLPLKIIVDKNLCDIRFEGEREDRATIIISAR